MIGLSFGAGEYCRELGFGDVFAGGWRGHFFLFFLCGLRTSEGVRLAGKWGTPGGGKRGFLMFVVCFQRKLTAPDLGHVITQSRGNSYQKRNEFFVFRP